MAATPAVEVAEAIRRALRPKASAFERLGLPAAVCEAVVVRRAYRTAALLIHPDKCTHPDAKLAFQRLSEAVRHVAEPKTRFEEEVDERGPRGGKSWWDAGFSEFEQRLRAREAEDSFARLRPDLPQEVRKEAVDAAVQRGEDSLDAYMSLLEEELAKGPSERGTKRATPEAGKQEAAASTPRMPEQQKSSGPSFAAAFAGKPRRPFAFRCAPGAQRKVPTPMPSSRASTASTAVSPAANSTTLRLADDISPANSSRSLKSLRTKHDLEKLEVPIALRRGSSVKDLQGGLASDYELEDEFGSVYIGRGRANNSTVAVKIIPRSRLKREDIFTEEVNTTKRLAHPNLIRLFASYRDESNFYLVMEFCKGGSLSELLQTRGLEKDEMGIWTEMIARYAWQMLSGIAYLHYHRIVHRDIKLENYMKVSKAEYADIKLIDFGLATKIKKGAKLGDVVGTVLTMAPEVRCRNYDEKVDVWGTGMCLYMCAVAMDPWFNEETHKQYEEDDIFDALDDPALKIQSLRQQDFELAAPCFGVGICLVLTYYERRWSLKEPGVRNLVESLLVVDPAKRPKAKDALG
eukprot:s147_g9.t1